LTVFPKTFFKLTTMLNQSHTSKQDTYYNRERPSIVNLIPAGPHLILDLGCASGAVGRRLLADKKAATVIGVELFPSAAQEAAQHYQDVHTGDIEEMTLPYKNHFDYVICGDILEHLKNPYAVIDKINGFLKPGGKLICSLPNIRHWQVLCNLALGGAWEYQDAGIMDRTHLRFFTRRSCHQMFRDGGLQVEQWQMLITGRKFKLINGATLGLFKEFIGTQVVTVATKPR